MDEDHQEDGEQDEEEGQGSETYAAQSNKAAKKVKWVPCFLLLLHF